MKRVKKKNNKVTRRDFLCDGATSTVGFAFLPSLATVLQNGRAMANANCTKEGGVTDAPAFIGIDLQGGASIAGNNVIVYDDGGQLLTSYGGLGLPPDLLPSNSKMINTELGLPMHAHSPMLRGIKEALNLDTTVNTDADDDGDGDGEQGGEDTQTGESSSSVLDKVNGCVICTQSADDTSSNRLATAPGIYMAGAQGLLVPLVGTRPSFPGGSGGNSATPYVTGVTPAFISNIFSAQQLISPAAFWANDPKRMEAVLSLIQDMSDSHLRRFSNMSLPEQTRAMIKCGYLDANNLLVQRGDNVIRSRDLNPRDDNRLRGINLGQVSEAAVEVAYLVLRGYAGSGTIAMGGYDYHDSTSSTGEARDKVAGMVIGTVLGMAAALQKKVMLHIYTDGGVDADENSPAQKVEEDSDIEIEKYTWRGDSEARSAAFVLVYDPSGRAELGFQQMGSYKSNDGGTVNLAPSKHVRICQSPEGQAAAVIANWLAWQGREKELHDKITDSPIREEELEEYLFMRKS